MAYLFHQLGERLAIQSLSSVRVFLIGAVVGVVEYVVQLEVGLDDGDDHLVLAPGRRPARDDARGEARAQAVAHGEGDRGQALQQRRLAGGLAAHDDELGDVDVLAGVAALELVDGVEEDLAAPAREGVLQQLVPEVFTRFLLRRLRAALGDVIVSNLTHFYVRGRRGEEKIVFVVEC